MELLSKTAWNERGFKVRRGQQPSDHRSGRVGGKQRTWAVYAEKQVEPKRVVPEMPAVEIDVLDALWVVNRYAKRARDAASRSFEANAHAFARTWKKRKNAAYDLKDQALHHLIQVEKVGLVGYHKFNDNWAEIWEGGGHRFHRPCPPPQGEATQVEDLGDQIEAQKRLPGEPRLKDAIHTLENYLMGKTWVDTYQWPERAKTTRVVCYACGKAGHVARMCRNKEGRWNDQDDEGF